MKELISLFSVMFFSSLQLLAQLAHPLNHFGFLFLSPPPDLLLLLLPPPIMRRNRASSPLGLTVPPPPPAADGFESSSAMLSGKITGVTVVAWNSSGGKNPPTAHTGGGVLVVQWTKTLAAGTNPSSCNVFLKSNVRLGGVTYNSTFRFGRIKFSKMTSRTTAMSG